MINIYYGPRFDHPFNLAWKKLKPLAKSLKDYNVENNRSYIMACPSYAQELKNKYVIESPFDLKIVPSVGEGKPPEVIVVSGLDTPQIGQGTQYDERSDFFIEDVAQFLSDAFYLFFADKSVVLKMTPPFLHHNKIFGIGGSMDIGSWFRALSFATYVENEVFIKAGEPLAYVEFSTTEKYKLIPILWPLEHFTYKQQCLAYKSVKSGSSLNQMYERFKMRGLRKKVVGIAKDAAKE